LFRVELIVIARPRDFFVFTIAMPPGILLVDIMLLMFLRNVAGSYYSFLFCAPLALLFALLKQPNFQLALIFTIVDSA